MVHDAVVAGVAVPVGVALGVAPIVVEVAVAVAVAVDDVDDVTLIAIRDSLGVAIPCSAITLAV
jgi:hypothetical protein